MSGRAHTKPLSTAPPTKTEAKASTPTFCTKRYERAVPCDGKLDRKPVKWEAGCMKTTLDLPDDLVRRMKIRAVQEGRPLKRLVAELLTRSLNAVAVPEPAPSTVTKRMTVAENGFPVFHCGPNASARRMTAEELIALENQTQLEEDISRAGITL